MPNSKSLCTVLTAWVLLGIAVPAHTQALDLKKKLSIDAVFAEYEGTGNPGCAVGVVQQGQLAYSRGYGVGQLDHSIPISPRSVFYLASVAKQFAAAAIVIAEYEELLEFDDDIRTYIPEFPDYGHTVTIRHLLHHTSGIRDYLALMQMAGTPLENILTDADMLDLISRQNELNFAPGSEYLYSNSGYILLAEIINRASGRSLREYAQEKIFGPLGMDDSHFHDDRTHVVAGRVFSYNANPDGSWRTNYLMNFDKVGDGGLYSTVEDLARWDAAFYDDRLGIPDFAERMYAQGSLNDGTTISYAMGLNVSERQGRRQISHGGGLMAFRTMISRYPDQQTSVITLCNDGSADSGRLSAAVEDILLEAEFKEPVALTRQPAQRPASPEPATTGAEPDLAAFAGTYYSSELDSTWVLEARQGFLELNHPNGSTMEFIAREGNLFSAGPIELYFERSNSNSMAFTLRAGRVRNILFTRTANNN